MRKHVSYLWLIALLLTALVTGCSDNMGGGISSDTTAPAVTSTDAADGAQGVAIESIITATFSEVMNPATITTVSFTLKDGTTPITGLVTYTGVTATFTPTAILPTNTTLTAIITTGASDLLGNTLVSDYSWTFTTALTPTAQYSLTVDAVHGSVTKSPNQATYSAGSVVALTAVPATGYHFIGWDGDLSGVTNPTQITMTGNKSVTASFALDHLGPAPVELGSAGNFNILAGSAVSNTDIVSNPTTIEGLVGVFPGSAVNGLPTLAVPASQIHAGDTVADAAKGALLAAYGDAVSRSANAISLPGNMGGLTLAPGLYVNSTSSGISGTGPNGILTLDAQGDPTAVWIFKLGSSLITDSGTSIVLAGGAQANNIFWQVGSSATFGTNSIFKGNILAAISITLTTGVNLEGRALTQTGAVTLDTNTITLP